MKLSFHPRRGAGAPQRGYLLTEALVYISVVVLILGAASVAVYRCIDASLVLRRGAEDIAASLRAGELWRADVRAATASASLTGSGAQAGLELKGRTGTTRYRFVSGAIDRRLGEGPWVTVLKDVKASEFRRDDRKAVTGWRWELELEPRARGAVKGSRIPLLFTFLATPGGASVRASELTAAGAGPGETASWGRQSGD